MNIEIMNYNDERVSVDIGKKEDIAVIDIQIVSGDEIAHVIYKDYSRKYFDSASLLNNFRIMDYNDAEYEAYNASKENNIIDNPNWLNRKTSYDGDDIARESEVEE